jgi:hypothetical protein
LLSNGLIRRTVAYTSDFCWEEIDDANRKARVRIA